MINIGKYTRPMDPLGCVSSSAPNRPFSPGRNRESSLVSQAVVATETLRIEEDRRFTKRGGAFYGQKSTSRIPKKKKVESGL